MKLRECLREIFSAAISIYLWELLKREWNTGWNKIRKLTPYRMQRFFEKGRSKGKWAGERLGDPASNQPSFIKSNGTCTYQHGIERALSLTVPCSLIYEFFSSDLWKTSYVFCHRPFITTQKTSPSPSHPIQHDGAVPRLAASAARLGAVWLCPHMMCLNYQILLRVGGFVGRSSHAILPLHSTAVAQANVHALPKLAYASLKIPPDWTNPCRKTHFTQAPVAVGKKGFVSPILKAALSLLNAV